MDDIDRDIINKIQTDFPITPRPFAELGERFNLSEQDVIERLERLKSDGVIRRIGGNFHSRKLGFTSTLCAAKVSDDALQKFIRCVNGYPGVTHNYLRNHKYNVWFTFIAPSMEFIERTLKDISKKTGVNEILNLPAIRMFKIKVDFEV
jgi:DNA-binding Lrp family transcriptional regulator